MGDENIARTLLASAPPPITIPSHCYCFKELTSPFTQTPDAVDHNHTTTLYLLPRNLPSQKDPIPATPERKKTETNKALQSPKMSRPTPRCRRIWMRTRRWIFRS